MFLQHGRLSTSSRSYCRPDKGQLQGNRFMRLILKPRFMLASALLPQNFYCLNVGVENCVDLMGLSVNVLQIWMATENKITNFVFFVRILWHGSLSFFKNISIRSRRATCAATMSTWFTAVQPGLCASPSDSPRPSAMLILFLTLSNDASSIKELRVLSSERTNRQVLRNSVTVRRSRCRRFSFTQWNLAQPWRRVLWTFHS